MNSWWPISLSVTDYLESFKTRKCLVHLRKRERERERERDEHALKHSGYSNVITAQVM